MKRHYSCNEIRSKLRHAEKQMMIKQMLTKPIQSLNQNLHSCITQHDC